MLKIVTLFTALFIYANAVAQMKDWELADKIKDGHYGISYRLAMQYLKALHKKPVMVIVADIDNGLAIGHPALKKIVWTNPKEKTINGKDDDHNGFVDDIHGWNFLGAKDGRNLERDSNEKDRLYWQYKDRFDPAIDTSLFSHSKNRLYNNWMTAKKGLPNGIPPKDQKPYDLRGAITGDNEDDIADQDYGNNDIATSWPTHGTHLAGIINKIAGTNFRIMPIRAALLIGEEHDKDIALAIRYAVDNGASIINMSFGRYYSPHPEWLEQAIRYAISKNVLLIHAAGNNNLNLDNWPVYPNACKLNAQGPVGWIEVGASQDSLLGETKADFSNYSKNVVDVFAPGVSIWSTIPPDGYAFGQGTSMASAVVAGMAALIKSYYPKLSAMQIKNIIERSVSIPGNNSLANYCRTGGIVNAYKAVKLAEKRNKWKASSLNR